MLQIVGQRVAVVAVPRCLAVVAVPLLAVAVAVPLLVAEKIAAAAVVGTAVAVVGTD